MSNLRPRASSAGATITATLRDSLGDADLQRGGTVNGNHSGTRSRRAKAAAKKVARRAAQLPWRATGLLPVVAQRRMTLLLGEPPLGPDGVWSAVDPNAAYDQNPSPMLVDLVLDAGRAASRLHLKELVDRATALESPYAAWAEMFPGEHYRLLAGLTQVLKPRRIIEIGTYTGASALAFLGVAGDKAHVITYDLLAWEAIPGTLLRADDFDDGRLEQRLGDLADDAFWGGEEEVFTGADLVFLDGPKDGRFEPLMLQRLADLAGKAHFVLVVDDIRFLEMIEAWAAFPAPKFDATSFGHWSGTGVAVVGAGAES